VKKIPLKCSVIQSWFIEAITRHKGKKVIPEEYKAALLLVHSEDPNDHFLVSSLTSTGQLIVALNQLEQSPDKKIIHGENRMPDFQAGYLSALAVIHRQHGCDTELWDALQCDGVNPIPKRSIHESDWEALFEAGLIDQEGYRLARGSKERRVP
jgi:hypothetical protein